MAEMGSRAFYGLLLAVTVLLVGMVSSAQAASPPTWTVSMTHNQDPFERGSEPVNVWEINMSNVGKGPASGLITFTDVLPPGVKVKSIGYGSFLFPSYGTTFPGCPSVAEINAGAPLTCTVNFKTPPEFEGGPEPVGPGVQLAPISITVEVLPGSPETLTNTFTLSGGGALAAATTSDTVAAIDQLPFHVKKFEAKSTHNGVEYTVAGGHQLETLNRFTFPLYPNEQFKNAFVKLPAGYFADPSSAPRCPLGNITSFEPFDTCPPGSKVGFAAVAFGDQYQESNAVPIYNVNPDRGYPAQFVFDIGNNQLSLYVVPLPRTEEYGLSIGSTNNVRVGIKSFSATFYGVPSEHGSGTSGAPFASNPVDCSEAEPAWRLFTDTWETPGLSQVSGLPLNSSEAAWKTATTATSSVTGCEDPALVSQFAPSLDVKPLQEAPAPQTDQPTGLAVNFHFPQTNDPTDLSTVFNPALPQAPELKTATVKLPAGLSISPSSAEGLEGCSDSATDPAGDQVHYDTTNPVSCPLASKIGTATVYTPLLASRDPVDGTVTGPEPIPGEVFLIKPHPGDLSASGDQDGTFRVLIQLELARYGVNFKLPGVITANKSTGQLTATFTENPQLPSSLLEVDFKQGPRAPLATPTTCGSFATTSDLVPWSSPGTPDANPSSSFAINAGPAGTPCASTPAARPFKPSLSAGTESAAAGQSSPFVLHLSRNDGEQEFSSLELTAPQGFTASLKGVPYCANAAIAAANGRSGAAELANPSCPAASQVGSLTVDAGPGSSPFSATGKAYLAGPYQGSPLSVALITPAVAGPFDLGSVVVRTPLSVNPETAQVTIHSAPIPQILDGVPLRIHAITVRIDRPGFTRNPTNCEATAVNATVNGSSGASATPSNSFQVEGCAQLGFAPKLALKLKGGTTRSAHPALTATVIYPKGAYANIASASVALPQSEFLAQNHIKTVCTRVQFAANACPAGSIYGHAKATTPLLDKPLEGPVYLRSSSHKLPDLVAALKGQIEVDLVGRIDSFHRGIRNTFEAVPDVPVSEFTLELEGGKKGLLENSENICRKAQHATADFTGQNGKVHNIKPLISNGCKKKSKKHVKNDRRHR
jgi:hypothetical protein